jgi:hypothetical protein
MLHGQITPFISRKGVAFRGLSCRYSLAFVFGGVAALAVALTLMGGRGGVDQARPAHSRR